MTVTISKPAVNLREELSALKKPTGIKGEELLRANTVADVYTSLNSTMFRNRLINGDMRIWQRGVTTTPGSGYSADMFRFEPRNGTTIYSDRSTDVPVGQGFTYSMRTYATGATDDGFHIRSYVELPASGVYGEFQPGTQWTVSFWMKSAYASRTINVTVGLAETAVGGSHQSQGVTSMQGTQFVTNQWQKYVFNFTLPSWVADNGSLSNVRCIYVRLLQGTDDLPQDTYVTGVQFEKGAVATPFEIRPIGTELLLCQRYYEKSFEYGTAPANGANGTSFATTNGLAFILNPHRGQYNSSSGNGYGGRNHYRFKVQKRATPSMAIYGNSNASPYKHGGSGSTWLTASYGTSQTADGFEFQNEYDGSCTFYNSIVEFHWTASAEL
jgi:hypothetical protein